ncbi:MAG: hypothetical protein IT442_05195 [Phycisphaeraceae bacterium]|nr:hypothetical protein [Phycisphaeraceae bacterium]
MTLRAGFGAADISPELGTEKLAWSEPIRVEKIVEPIGAHALVLDDGRTRLGFVSVDLASVPDQVVSLSRELAADLVPAEGLLIAATHNHAAPGFHWYTPAPGVKIYEPSFVAGRIRDALAQAVAALEPAQLGVGSGVEGRISFIRRCIMLDGTVKTQPRPGDPDIRCEESVIDPEVGVVGVKVGGQWRGAIVNFALHPTQFGGDSTVRPGYPGELAKALRDKFGPQFRTVFLNGAAGDVHAQDRLNPHVGEDATKIGQCLAQTAAAVLGSLTVTDDLMLGSQVKCLVVPWRDPDAPPIGPPGQFYHPPEIRRQMEDHLRQARASSSGQDYPVQRLTLGDRVALIAAPGELFSELGLRIKLASSFPRTYVVAYANGSAGYIPTLAAHRRGGYECSLGVNRLAPQAGDVIVDAAIDLLRRDPRD